MTKRRFFSLLAVFGLLLPALGTAPATGQWQGRAVLQGTVVDHHGAPLAGATVVLRPEGDDGAEATGPEPIVTGDDGGWSALGVEIGRWTIRVQARGFYPATGRVTAQPRPDSVDVELRPLTEVPPAFPEGDAQRFASEALELADQLVAQGDVSFARREYLRALRALPEPAQRAEILRHVARTHHLEGETDLAVLALRHALVLDPGSELGRRLYLGVAPDGAPWLADLDARGPEAVAAELDPLPGLVPARPSPPTQPLEIRPLDPEPGRTGAFTLRLPSRSPESSPQAVAERLDVAARDLTRGGALAYLASDESLELIVPDSYRPDEGWGAVVWVSPTPRGFPPMSPGPLKEELVEVLARHRLLWVGANGSGNQRAIADRLGLALDAAHTVRDLYDLDSERLVVAGYSGGGRMASMLSNLWPDVFAGGLFVRGADFYRPLSIPDRPGFQGYGAFREPPRSQRRTLQEDRRFVVLTGEHDFNRVQSREVAEAYRQDGYRHVTYLEIPGASHYTPLGPDDLDRALSALVTPPASE